MNQAAIRPQPGFQERVLSSSADILISGGAAGAGKTWSSVAEALRHANNPEFRAVIFRRTSPELTGAGSVWEEGLRLYLPFGAKPRTNPTLEFVFPSGARVELRHLQYLSDVYAHQSKAYALIIFEEVCGFLEAQFWYLVSRMRSMSGVRPYMRCTCNPDPDSFVAKLIEWWIDQNTGLPIPERSGILRWFVRDGEQLDWGDTKEEVEARHPELPPNSALSMTFIGGKLSDNPAMTTADPTYAARLSSLPRVLRERLRDGNWKTRASAGSYFRRGYFQIIDEPPTEIVKSIRFWDRAATEVSAESPDPDWTVGARMAKLADGRYLLQHIERLRGSPGIVERTIRRLAEQDGQSVTVGVFQDPGSAGKTELHHVRQLLDGFTVKVTGATQAKETMAGPLSSAAEGERVLLLRGPWNDAFIDEAEAFPKVKHDDQVDAAAGAYNALQQHVEVCYA